MTDLVAEAIALCERQIVYWESVSETVPPLHAAHSKNQRNSWLTHKAEFEGHKGAHSEVGYVCQKCTKSFSQDGMTIRQYPCDFATTKAQRLLGKE